MDPTVDEWSACPRRRSSRLRLPAATTRVVRWSVRPDASRRYVGVGRDHVGPEDWVGPRSASVRGRRVRPAGRRGARVRRRRNGRCPPHRHLGTAPRGRACPRPDRPIGARITWPMTRRVTERRCCCSSACRLTLTRRTTPTSGSGRGTTWTALAGSWPTISPSNHSWGADRRADFSCSMVACCRAPYRPGCDRAVNGHVRRPPDRPSATATHSLMTPPAIEWCCSADSAPGRTFRTPGNGMANAGARRRLDNGHDVLTRRDDISGPGAILE